MKLTHEDPASIRVDVAYVDASMQEARFHASDRSRDALVRDIRTVAVRDARPDAERYSLDREGFMFVTHKAIAPHEPGFVESNLDRRHDMPPQNARYVAELMPLVRALTGAREIVPQAGRIVVRVTGRTGMTGSDPIAPLVHLDYTERAVKDAIIESCALAGRPVPGFSRVLLLQTWRVLTPPPNDNVLAICDARSVSLDQSIVMTNYLGRPGEEGEEIETRLCRYDPAHRWYYLCDMGPEDLLIFKGFDSDDPTTMTGAHVAIDLPTSEDPHGRISVEARFLAFY